MQGLLVAHLTVLLTVVLFSKGYAEDASALGPPPPSCCAQGPVAFMRAANKISLELVKRETDDRNFAYFVDTSASLENIGVELQTRIGKKLKSSSFFHEHNVPLVLSAHRRANGWPSANHIDIKDHAIRSVCILSPLSHERTAVEFASRLMGTPLLPVAHGTDEYAIRLLSAFHESFHCIAAHRSNLDHREKTALETIADVGAVNEALKLGMDRAHLIALADWRSLRYASGIADVVAGRVSGTGLYFRASPSHMTTVAINRLLSEGPVDGYEQIETLALSSTPEGLFGERKTAQKFLTRTMLLFKNSAVKQRFPNASIQDADDILSMIGAPEKIIEAVKQSVARYLSKLACRRAAIRPRLNRASGLVCRQSDGSYAFAGGPILGIKTANGVTIGTDLGLGLGASDGKQIKEIARLVFSRGKEIIMASHAQHHFDQGHLLRIARE